MRPEGKSPDQESDSIPGWSIVAVAISAVIIGVGSVLISSELLTRWQHGLEGGPPPRPAQAPRTVGMVEQTLIADDRLGLRIAAEKRAELERYGWVDRQKGLIRIPIERAFDLLLAERQR